jgi:peptidoglycan/xylan/chitin deacetylase (PgdA/CDA1 family)|tara:strand:- start:3137 stop:3910 length:774 start_codon:yes stop_codon:yes gene_type:complete
MIKSKIQKFIRIINIALFKKNLPDQIVVYFHETEQVEITTIQDIILFFKNMDYEFVSVSKISKNFGTNKKMFSFTFDDGFKNWENLIPVFVLYGVKATFYLNSVFLTDEGNDNFMRNIGLDNESKIINKNIISELVEHNHEIGAHTHSHYKLSNLEFDDFKREVDNNLSLLKQFSSQIQSFAIPFGMRRYLNKDQIEYLTSHFETVCFGEAGMLFNQDEKSIQRYPWQMGLTFYQNLINLSTNTNFFNRLTKRSGLG